MATPIDRRQVEQWLTEGASLRQIARRLGLPLTTFHRQWQRLQREAATPVLGEVTELPPARGMPGQAPRPGPPPGPPIRPPARPPEGPPEVHRGIPAELQAMQSDLAELVQWWRERKLAQVHPGGRRGDMIRYTIHLHAAWVARLKQQAADEGITISELANRALQRYFEGA
jgi:hypothetical protein